MKFSVTLFILITVPVVLTAVLFITAIPLIYQHFRTVKLSEADLYPHVTTWEEDPMVA